MNTKPRSQRSIIQFSLRGLLMFFTATALGLAALCQASSAWTGTIVFVTFVMILAAVIGAVYPSPRGRAFCLGFAVCTGSYFLFFFLIPVNYPGVQNEQRVRLIDRMPTTKAINWLFGIMHPDSIIIPGGSWPESEAPAVPAVNGGALQVASQASPNLVVIPTADDYERVQGFQMIGQCLWAWIFGWIGGLFAQFLARRQARASELQKVASSAAAAAKPV